MIFDLSSLHDLCKYDNLTDSLTIKQRQTAKNDSERQIYITQTAGIQRLNLN